MSLYGEFDRRIGHYRRYTKTEIEEKCQKAGLKIVKSKYFDFAGIFPWYVKYKLLKSDTLESGAVTLYDKVAVPVIQKFEKILPIARREKHFDYRRKIKSEQKVILTPVVQSRRLAIANL